MIIYKAEVSATGNKFSGVVRLTLVQKKGRMDLCGR